MIHYITGNLLDSNAEALVNTVNTVGVMGKGIALQFKNTFPDNFKIYSKACKTRSCTLDSFWSPKKKHYCQAKRLL